MNTSLTQKKNIAIVYPAGLANIDDQQKQQRIAEFKTLGFEITDLAPSLPNTDNCTAAPVLERATSLSYALSMRKFDIIIAARGGVGTTELVPFLENMLAPVISEKILVGFSDISFLGVYLARRFPNLTYVHAQNFFTAGDCSAANPDIQALIKILNREQFNYSFPVDAVKTKRFKLLPDFTIEGSCIPINLSLAESLSACSFIKLPEDNIVFLEDCNEYTYKIIRKIDSLINAKFLQYTKAIVLGNFNNCRTNTGEEIPRAELIQLFERKTSLPIFDLPIFGHTQRHFPLVMLSQVKIDTNQIQLSNTKAKTNNSIKTSFDPTLFNAKLNKDLKVHFTGIGGTGMAQVAGFFINSGATVTGSDNKIYPPMDDVINRLNIKPDIGFNAHNIENNQPDIVILANVISRLNANLQKNAELEALLCDTIPLLSFPAALRKYFLHSSCNIIVSGTHGKTTTSALLSYLLDGLNYNPSFFIGGMSANFSSGFALRSPNLYVLEGDEYDTAFFDKGPKFLHYEPSISLLNNIEFDHADIYKNLQEIIDEFQRLAQCTYDKNGFIIANLDDENVVKIIKQHANYHHKIIGFAKNYQQECAFPIWKLTDFKFTKTGMLITTLSPNKQIFSFYVNIFGLHNALNCIAAIAVIHAYQKLINTEDEYAFIAKISSIMPGFRGVKRRFELLAEHNDIAVFDDFAHHPTAIATTIKAFRAYMRSAQKSGRLIICFDPRNATMRRNILQAELAKSFAGADKLYLGAVPKDLRMQEDLMLNSAEVIESYGKENGRYFIDNQILLSTLQDDVSAGDVVVFMSSGAFDDIAHKFANYILTQK